LIAELLEAGEFQRAEVVGKVTVLKRRAL
jgi:hypothetical protein